MKEDAEYSESGTPILRHEARERAFEAPVSDAESVEKIEAHLSKHIGEAETVLHEIVSDLVHLDVHLFPPSPERNFFTLVTTGMSDRPMNVPEDQDELRYAELLICLPASWPMPKVYEVMTNEEDWWPIRLLKFLARFPHEYETWLGHGHTLPNGDPPVPYATNTKLCCAMLSIPLLFGREFPTLKVNEEKTVNFYSLIPLYREEMEFKLKKGLDDLYQKFDAAGINELLDINRKNVCRKLFGLF